MGHSKKQLKLIELITRNVEMTREFMNDWLLFNQILSSYPSPGVNKMDLEQRFLKIKSKLARTHRVLKDTLASDYSIDGGTMNIVSGATSLEAIHSQSEVAIKKLQTEWHRAFISINETLGVLDDKRARAEAGEKIFMAPVGGGAAGPAKGKGMDKNVMIILGGFGVLAILAVLIAINPGGALDMWAGPIDDLLGTSFHSRNL
jgi:hypothetical protein